MEKIFIKARAKINLTLNILGKRKDGYHNLESIFQKISLYDEMYIYKRNNNIFKLETNVQEIEDRKNIIYKAYILLKKLYPIIKGIEVKLIKHIPLEAGLGGGSTDCASFLVAINKLYDLKLSETKLIDIGKTLGADVVPCLYNTALAKGIGDKISKINTQLKYYILIIKPKFKCNTKAMFKMFDESNKLIQINNNSKVQQALENNDVKRLAQNLYNIFENTIERKQEIQRIKEDLVKNGAIGSLMTGSGSCVYGIFENRNIIKEAYKKLSVNYKTYMCISCNF